MESRKARVERGERYLMVPHGEVETFFGFPPAGPGTYKEVRNQILDSGLEIPTGDYSASLIHAAYDSDDPEFEHVRKIMKNSYFWIFNRNAWTKNGVFVQQDPDGEGISKLDVSELEKELAGGYEVKNVVFSRDGKLRFAPKGTFRGGEHTPESLARDGFVIAGYGEEGAEKLAYVSKKFRDNPYLWIIDSDDLINDIDGILTVSALDEYYGGLRLIVLGGCLGGYGDGRALGVREAPKARR